MPNLGGLMLRMPGPGMIKLSHAVVLGMWRLHGFPAFMIKGSSAVPMLVRVLIQICHSWGTVILTSWRCSNILAGAKCWHQQLSLRPTPYGPYVGAFQDVIPKDPHTLGTFPESFRIPVQKPLAEISPWHSLHPE